MGILDCSIHVNLLPAHTSHWFYCPADIPTHFTPEQTTEKKNKAHLLSMSSIVQPQTPHCPDVLRSQRRQQQPDVSHNIGDGVLAEDVALHNASLTGLGNIGHSPGENGIAVVSPAVPSQETNKALLRGLVSDLKQE